MWCNDCDVMLRDARHCVPMWCDDGDVMLRDTMHCGAIWSNVMRWWWCDEMCCEFGVKCVVLWNVLFRDVTWAAGFAYDHADALMFCCDRWWFVFFLDVIGALLCWNLERFVLREWCCLWFMCCWGVVTALMCWCADVSTWWWCRLWIYDFVDANMLRCQGAQGRIALGWSLSTYIYCY
jgi:hypothetical protein